MNFPSVSKTYFLTSVDSTNREAIRLGKEGGEHGTLVVAEGQTAGRGRLGRHWDSPPGKGLYFSLLLRPPLAVAQASLITLAVGLAMGEALREMGIVELLIKWPNDLWVGEKKLGGILTEMFNHGNEIDFVVVGVGINLNTRSEDLSPEVADLAISLEQILKKNFDREEILTKILPGIFQEIDRLVKEGAKPLTQRWEEKSGMMGKRVQVAEDGRKIEGMVSGLAEDGQLQIKTDAGEIISIIAGDVMMS